MAMTPAQVAAELQRKKNAGEQPTNKANQSAYDKLTPTTPKPYTPTFSAYGGKDNYVANQNARWQAANETGDTDLMKRLHDDSVRANYTLNPYTPKTETSPQNKSNIATQDDLLSRINAYLDKQTAREIPQFNYDPNSDPQYQAALSRAKANSETASGNAMAELNKRGILNSTITSDRLGQIEQAEYGRVSDTILPQLMQQAYNRHRDTVNDEYKASQDEIRNLYDLLGITSDLDQRKFDNTMRQNEFDWGKTYDTANLTGNFNGQRTLEGQRQDYDRMIDQRDFETDQGQRELENQWYLSEQTGVISPYLSQLYGIPKGTPTQSAKQFALEQAVRQQNADRLSSRGGSGGGSGGGSSAPKPINLNNVIDNIDRMYTQYNRNTGGRDVINKDGLKAYIESLGLPEDQKTQIYALYGLSSGSGGSNFWDITKNILSGLAKGAGTSNNSSSVSDADIEEYVTRR